MLPASPVIIILTILWKLSVAQTNNYAFFSPKTSMFSREDDSFQLPFAVCDVIVGLPPKTAVIAWDAPYDEATAREVAAQLAEAATTVSLFHSPRGDLNQTLAYLADKKGRFEPVTTLFLVASRHLPEVVSKIVERDVGWRGQFFVMLLRREKEEEEAEEGGAKVEDIKSNIEAELLNFLKVVLVVPPLRVGHHTWDILFSQGRSDVSNVFTKVNTWVYNDANARKMGVRLASGLQWPTMLRALPSVPSAEEVFRNFEGRVFKVPILTAEPFASVQTDDDGRVLQARGRDVTIVHALASALNFSVEFVTPPERGWGSRPRSDGYFPGLVGTVVRRETDLLVDSVTITPSRYAHIDYSVPTHDDSGCFVTRAPQINTPATALIRPFTLLVWCLIVGFNAAAGPVLYLFIRFSPLQNHHLDALQKCSWFVFGCQLNQSMRDVQGNGVRVFVFFWIAFALFTGVMFSCNLVSFYTYPGTGKPLNSLDELIGAMKSRKIYLGVEKDSSTEGLLRSSFGTLQEAWQLMKEDPTHHVRLDSNIEGLDRILQVDNYAWVGGRGVLTFTAMKRGKSSFLFFLFLFFFFFLLFLVLLLFSVKFGLIILPLFI
ncbi:ionotropic receptor 40a-like [Oratosquilla oratoria]|uniref:ionotropic receptor 40a-like n=1 Tax=Oratosquilla oratoria TaxID=337810 RepID=UPI003F763C25